MKARARQIKASARQIKATARRMNPTARHMKARARQRKARARIVERRPQVVETLALPGCLTAMSRRSAATILFYTALAIAVQGLRVVVGDDAFLGEMQQAEHP